MKRKTLTTALLAGLTGAVGIANMSNAVNLNPDGLGQTLIYPYYNVRGGYDTLVSVVNTTGQVKAVKVRFLEALNSREVLDFNLYLSPFDVWTAAVSDDGNGGRIFTADNSCTTPAIPAEGVPFRNFAYVGDLGGDSLDRTREGHLEMIEMGVVSDTANGAWATAATHVAGVPTSCATLINSWRPGGYWSSVDSSDGISAPAGGLFGGASLIDVEGGVDAGYNADAIDDFSETELHTAPGLETPSLQQANDGFADVESIVFVSGNAVSSTWDFGEDAVSAIYMHDTVMNEYVLDEATLSGTDWVVTFPTKRFYVDDNFTSGGRTAPVQPFTSVWDGSACEDISLTIWDREETTTVGDIDFSPLPPQGGNVLCWETNVVTFENSDVLASNVSENVPSQGFENGWLRISFDNISNQMTSNDGDQYFGLPATGFAVQTFNNGQLEVDGANVLSNYAGLFGHRHTRDVCDSGSADLPCD